MGAGVRAEAAGQTEAEETMDAMKTDAVLERMEASLERLATAATMLEGLMERLDGTGAGGLAKITASVEGEGLEPVAELGSGVGREAGMGWSTGLNREAELERRATAAEGALAVLRAERWPATALPGARKTLPAATVQLLAKGGIEAGESVDVGTLDRALAGLSVEERMAVKGQMLRTGTLVR